MRYLITAVCCSLVLWSSLSLAQTREEGPWWPHPIWGAEDQAGASNWITPEKVLQAVQLVREGRIYELGQVYDRNMPIFGERTYSLVIPGGPTYNEPFGKNALIGNDEFIVGELGQVGTQFDGLTHIGTRLTMGDGTVRDVYYNGFTGEEILGAQGMRELGIEKIRPIVTRGILLDIAGYKDVERLPNGYEVTVEDVRGALRRQNIDEESIRPGDAFLFRYGWSSLWDDPERYNDSPAGVGLAVARWVIDRKATMIGSDSWTSEVVPNPDPGLVFPVHQELLTKNGIFNIENLDLDELASEGVYEFLFVFAPVPFRGATGSPGRPIAIR
ncbi:MAG: cyclase family protein [Xanthomonadales bacterium]|jgi:kynurenine formamidase|nr:cyclase family protein [Xanthomonadales bacterium]